MECIAAVLPLATGVGRNPAVGEAPRGRQPGPLAWIAALALLAAAPVAAQSTFVEACLETDNGHYVTAHRGGDISAVVDQCRGYELFELEDINGGQLESHDWVYIKTAHGQYWTATPSGQLSATVEHRRGWERFQIVRDPGSGYFLTDDSRMCQGGTFNLVSAHALYVSARHGGGDDVYANGPQPKSWERLTLQTEAELCEGWWERPVQLVMLRANSMSGFRVYRNDHNAVIMSGFDSNIPVDPAELSSNFLFNPETHTLHLASDAEQCASIQYNSFVEDDVMIRAGCDYDDPNQHWTFHVGDGTLRPLSNQNLCAALDQTPNNWSTILIGDLEIDFEGTTDLYTIDIEDCDASDEDQRYWRLRY